MTTPPNTGPRAKALSLGALLLSAGLAACTASPEPDGHPPDEALIAATSAIELDTAEELADAVFLFKRSTLGAFTVATDPNERGETLIYPESVGVLAEDDLFEEIFGIGDEAFEAERDRQFGLGRAPLPPLPLPTPSQRIQTGELGGVDSTSCRSCHFTGGPDGAGTATQVGLFRGDGRRLSSATVREAPHVMGLGYITLMARQIDREIQHRVFLGTFFAENDGVPSEVNLNIDGIDFGRVTISPEGDIDTSQIIGISPDLVVRPFGFKGRHRDLVHLTDEALQLHHGLQSAARAEVYADQAATYLGDNEDSFDRDGDGIQSDASGGQSVLLASYLSMLAVPNVRPPEDPRLAFVWARGRAVFDEVDCGSCHRPSTRLTGELVVTHEAIGATDLTVSIDLREFGQDPRPSNLDFGQLGDDENILVGVPIYPFTDLRRHDMGPELAEPGPEILPDGGGEIPGEVWLTRSLWGLADTAPYLHDGRAPTVHDAIVWHGGEGAESRDAYLALDGEDQAALRVFLLSLTRAPTVLVD